MKVFHCDHCGHLLFFESVSCVRCGQTLAYVPGLGVVASLDQDDKGVYRSPLPRAKGQTFRLCRNYTENKVCNWALDADDKGDLCRSCALTKVIPDLSVPGHLEGWAKLEAAKRRLVYTLDALHLPLHRTESPGLRFEFLADTEKQHVLTGHDDGLITVNIAEADDAEREKRRHDMHEPYRTLLGHMRHESGHYYFIDLVSPDPKALARCREVFGDEREDYAAALKRNYESGPPPDWAERYVSSYAASHPAEDWAETWAHYLHMTDSLEMAATCGVSLLPRRRDEPIAVSVPNPLKTDEKFDDMLNDWHALTYMLNNLNRSMGLQDGYPFVLSSPAMEKLRLVHELVMGGEPGSAGPS